MRGRVKTSARTIDIALYTSIRFYCQSEADKRVDQQVVGSYGGRGGCAYSIGGVSVRAARQSTYI